MKTTSLRLLLVTTACGLLTAFVHAGHPSGGWQGTQQIKTFTAAKAVGSDAIVTMASDKCKTVMIRETKHVGPQGKGPDAMFVVGSKHTCEECAGEITVVKGKTTDSAAAAGSEGVHGVG